MVKKSVFLMSICALSLATASTAEAVKFNQDNLGEMDNSISKSPQMVLSIPPKKPNKTMTEKRKNEAEERRIKADLIKRKLDF